MIRTYMHLFCHFVQIGLPGKIFLQVMDGLFNSFVVCHCFKFTTQKSHTRFLGTTRFLRKTGLHYFYNLLIELCTKKFFFSAAVNWVKNW